MKYLLSIIILSFSFSSYYTIGDTVNSSHQNESFDVCYGDYPSAQFQLSHFNGKIKIFGLSTSWWPTTCTFSLEALIDSLENDSRIEIFESLDDIGMPYSCSQWGDFGQQQLPMIVETNNQFFEWFSIDGYYGVVVVLDPNMIFRYIGAGVGGVLNAVEQILLETNWIIGDINQDSIIDILDIISIVNIIFENEYNYLADINSDSIINVLDIISIVSIILN